MKGLILLVLLALAAWYGWKHYPDLVKPSHEAIVENGSSMTAIRVTFKVGSQGFASEILPPGQKAKFNFQVTDDSEFSLEWGWQGVMGEHRWQGGKVFKGPMMTRQYFTLEEGDVVHRTENKVGI